MKRLIVLLRPARALARDPRPPGRHFIVLAVLVALGVPESGQDHRPVPEGIHAAGASRQWNGRGGRDLPVPNTAVREALLAELQPVTLGNCRPERFGSVNDGGYAMCGNLLAGVETAYSYGIGGQDDWGCEVSVAYGVPVHQYDCFDLRPVRCAAGIFRRYTTCVGPRLETIDGRQFEPMASQIARNGDTNRRTVVKMDIEGAEWQTILAAPDSLFGSIEQMAMELHGVDDREVLEGLRKLKRHFHLVSVHYNNWSCDPGAAPLKSWAYQVLLVNKNIAEVGPPRPEWPALASVLAPDNPLAPECR